MGKREAQINVTDVWPEQLSMIVEQLPAVPWTTDAALRVITSWGARRADIGLAPEQLVGNQLADILGTREPHHLAVSAHQRALNGEIVTYEAEWQARCFHVRVQPLREGNGIIVGTNGVAIDVTERRQAEATLREREARLQVALDIAEMATWDLDLASGSLIRSNWMAALYGLPDHALHGTSTAHFGRVHPDDIGITGPIDRLHLSQSIEYDIEFRVIWPNGSTHWLRERADSIRDECVRAVRQVGVTMDITARKEAEASLRQSESRFRSLVQNALEMTTIMKADGQIVYESPSNERVLGYKVGDLATTNGFAMVHPDDLTVAREQFAESLAQAGSTVRAELRVRHKNGS